MLCAIIYIDCLRHNLPCGCFKQSDFPIKHYCERGVEPVAKIPEAVIEQVRDATDIVDFISQYVQLQKSGKNLFGLCPFHEERTPSFSVSEDKQIFHCFSCGRGGNVFKFIMELENIGFQEAVVKVAEFSHVDLPDSVANATYSGQARQDSPANHLIQLHEGAQKLYHHILMNTEIGQPALDYLHQRGLTDKTIEDFGLGFAPDQQLLKQYFDQQKVDYQELRHTGLFIENQSGELRDRFFNRVMYPIKNESGQPIAFSGRLLVKADDQPKYLNSPETDIFNKRRVLFNFDQARNVIRKEGAVILFEGFMDVMSAHQSGVGNGVASMGTSLTEEQIYAMQRVTKQVYVCYDGDTPGQRATNRALTILRDNSSLALGVIQMPEGMDPDEYRKKYGEEKLASALQSARETPIAFAMHYLKSEHDVNTDAGRLEYIDQVLNLLATVTSPVEQDVYLTQLANEYQLDKGSLKQQLLMIKPKPAKSSRPAPATNPYDGGYPQSGYQNQEPPAEVTQYQQAPPLSRTEKAERGLLLRMLHDHSVWLRVTGIENFSFESDDYELIYMLAQKYFQTHQTYAPAQFIDLITDDHLQNMVIELESLNINDEAADEEVDDYLRVIMNEAPLEKQLTQSQQALNEAKRLGDNDRVRQLVIEIIKLQQQKQSNKRA